MKLYKYRGNFKRDLKTLSKGQIYAPTYDNLNDPFECIFNRDEDTNVIEIFKPYSHNVEQSYNNVVEQLFKLGIYSLSKDFDNEILWALYADSHKGFTIEYDIETFVTDFNFNTNIPLVHKVNVDYKAAPAKSNLLLSSLKNQLDLIPLIGTKSLPWKIENEFRLVFEMNGLININLNSVTSIIFGLRTTDENIDKTMKMLRGRGIKYLKMKKMEGSYKLTKISIEDKFKDYKRPSKRSIIKDINIPSEYTYLKIEINKIIKSILDLPNIKGIYNFYFDSETTDPVIKIFATTTFEKIPLRYFQYKVMNNSIELDKQFV
ncbi:DUF2971 domain-containing protein [Chryseobacterium sp. 22543]|uniref:DUF2971 domain-containing protein n=1 Tax=Chryseobacterium sp. 22543 TaxID=3453940 RepID=UPI003F830110